MGELRIVKKYPNRRLYDSTESRYVSLEDLQKMVALGFDLVVIDKVTGRDITRPVLLRVVTASEQGSGGVLSREFLLQVIRSQDDDAPSVVASYLENSLNLLRGAGDLAGERVLLSNAPVVS